MTIETLFGTEYIDLDLVEEREGESEYWNSACSFILNNWYNDINDLSEKQAMWANRIFEDMTEYRIGKQRNLV